MEDALGRIVESGLGTSTEAWCALIAQRLVFGHLVAGGSHFERTGDGLRPTAFLGEDKAR